MAWLKIRRRKIKDVCDRKTPFSGFDGQESNKSKWHANIIGVVKSLLLFWI